MHAVDEVKLYLAVAICCLKANRKAAPPRRAPVVRSDSAGGPATFLLPSQESSVHRLRFSQQPSLVRQTKHLSDVEHLKGILESGRDDLETALHLEELADVIRSDIQSSGDIRPHPELPQLLHAAQRRRKKFD